MPLNKDPNTKPPPTPTQQTAIEDHLTSNRIITVDYARYEHLLDDPNLSEDQKRELLQTIWNIIVAFVEMGWGVHPVQQVQDNACGQLSQYSAEKTTKPHIEVQSRGINLTKALKKAAKV